MDDVSARVLAQLEPEGLGAEGQSWQQRKSVQTRVTILEAAIECLRRHGYGRTTTQLIAEIAGISRGAMLHHYATKQDLMASVIDYTMYKRMVVFLDGARALKDADRIIGMAGIEVFWESLLTAEFSAYLELAIAARTDPELAEVFLPKARRYDRTELAEVIRAFPEWAEHFDAYALAMDYCHTTMQGLLINRDIWREEDQATLRRFVGKTVAMILSGDLSPAA
jgi:AcrR family transcriptional regulator